MSARGAGEAEEATVFDISLPRASMRANCYDNPFRKAINRKEGRRVVSVAGDCLAGVPAGGRHGRAVARDLGFRASRD